IFRVSLSDVGARHPHIGTERAQMLNLFARHLVGNDKDDAIVFQDSDLREAEARISGRRLDDRAAGAKLSAALRSVDHGKRDAILDRAAGVLIFQLYEQTAGTGIEPGQLQKSRVANKIKCRMRSRGNNGSGGCHDAYSEVSAEHNALLPPIHFMPSVCP